MKKLLFILLLNATSLYAAPMFKVKCSYTSTNDYIDAGIFYAKTENNIGLAFENVELQDSQGNLKKTLFSSDYKCGRKTDKYTQIKDGSILSPNGSSGLSVIEYREADDFYKDGSLRSILGIRNKDKSGIFTCFHMWSSPGEPDSFDLQLSDCEVEWFNSNSSQQ